MFAKGRNISVGIPGEAHHQAKLTEEQVLSIRCDLRPNKELAHLYGVTSSLIGQIKRKVIWKHLC